jgi:hypothetical protein
VAAEAGAGILESGVLQASVASAAKPSMTIATNKFKRM